jgi:hypothetical protein
MTAVPHGPLAALGGLAMTGETLRLNEKRYDTLSAFRRGPCGRFLEPESGGYASRFFRLV